MVITKEQNGSELIIRLSGRLSISEAKELEKIVRSDLSGITDLTFDFRELSHVASAGLRVLFTAQEMMDQSGGSMKLVSVNNVVREVLRVTGMDQFMTIKQ